MSSVNTNDRDLDAKALNAEAADFANLLAQHVRLDNPLPAGQDFSILEDLEAQTQVRKLLCIGRSIIDSNPIERS
jgi:hypothetical protein